MASAYRIVFAGEIVQGVEPAAVKASFQKLFKADSQRIEALFSGKRVVIKKDVDEQTARKYQATLRKVGAVCQIESVHAEPAAPPPAAAARTREAAQDWRLEAPGADLRDPGARQVRPTPPAAADVTLAPVGADLLDRRARPEPFEPDLHELSMAPPGSPLLPEPKARPAPPPDVGDLTLED